MKKAQIIGLLCGVFAISNPVFAQTTQAKTMTTQKTNNVADVSVQSAQNLIQIGTEYAHKNNRKISIAIVDRSGNLVAFSRMDNASLVSIDVAIGKAKSSAYLQAPSKKFEDFVNQGRTSMLNVPHILPLQGGVPLMWQGQIVGAVGVSGADGDTDNRIAEYIANEFAK